MPKKPRKASQPQKLDRIDKVQKEKKVQKAKSSKGKLNRVCSADTTVHHHLRFHLFAANRSKANAKQLSKRSINLSFSKNYSKLNWDKFWNKIRDRWSEIWERIVIDEAQSGGWVGQKEWWSKIQSKFTQEWNNRFRAEWSFSHTTYLKYKINVIFISNKSWTLILNKYIKVKLLTRSFQSTWK